MVPITCGGKKKKKKKGGGIHARVAYASRNRTVLCRFQCRVPDTYGRFPDVFGWLFTGSDLSDFLQLNWLENVPLARRS